MLMQHWNFVTFSPFFSSLKSYAYGFIGTLKSVPVGHTHSTIMFAGQGVKATMAGWGAALLKVYEVCLTFL